MKILNALLATATLITLSACTTVVGPDGRPRQALTPTGAAVVQGLVATGVGVGTGALMNKQPGWATGGVSSLAGNVSSQLVNNFLPKAGDRPLYANNGPQQPAQQYYQNPQPANYRQPAPGYNPNVGYNGQVEQNYYAQDRAYVRNQAPANEPVYRQLPDGRVVQIN